MPKALQHMPLTQDGPLLHGYVHVVSARRARKLRKRGVPVKPFGARSYAWAEPTGDVDRRRQRRAGLCYEMHCMVVRGKVGRKHWLATRLAEQRAAHQRAMLQRKFQHLGRRLHKQMRMSEAEMHTYLQQGYAIRGRARRVLGATHGDRRSPPITMWVPCVDRELWNLEYGDIEFDTR